MTGVLPGILNLREPEAEVGLNLVRASSGGNNLRAALVNAFDPGGAAVSLVLGKWRNGL